MALPCCCFSLFALLFILLWILQCHTIVDVWMLIAAAELLCALIISPCCKSELLWQDSTWDVLLQVWCKHCLDCCSLLSSGICCELLMLYLVLLWYVAALHCVVSDLYCHILYHAFLLWMITTTWFNSKMCGFRAMFGWIIRLPCYSRSMLAWDLHCGCHWAILHCCTYIV